MTVVDCKFYQLYRESVFVEEIRFQEIKEDDCPKLSSYQIKEYKNIWVPEDFSECRKLAARFKSHLRSS